MKRVLVVDDEKDIGMLVAHRLRAAGYEPVWCADGAAAWERLRRDGADLAVLDVNMPVMGGLELCQRIRADPRLRDLPILMLTVRSGLEEQIEGYETGADDYLAKPFDPDMVAARLKALERRTIGSAS